VPDAFPEGIGTTRIIEAMGLAAWAWPRPSQQTTDFRVALANLGGEPPSLRSNLASKNVDATKDVLGSSLANPSESKFSSPCFHRGQVPF